MQEYGDEMIAKIRRGATSTGCSRTRDDLKKTRFHRDLDPYQQTQIT